MTPEMTTLCYIEQNSSYLMLHRVKKERDINKDKWIGIGGHFEGTESPEECLLREVKEETGLTLTDYSFRGIVTFISETEVPVLEYMLPLWTGDKIFLRLLEEERPFFSLKLVYTAEGVLREAVLDGKRLDFSHFI